ncbi:membrane protein [Haematobacter missouriensis]|uniref:Protein HflK n=1 Tax=Haematobacter missouriensis TaxID=366616 RepID=A0A212AVT4_9RHOB|nr:FtsH protease activity modulator HflK [Haematobacter missouriensis]KFI33653.1 membrane protein [Haematobacter missouriensis]OWJ75647.1 HflK protein [Haematobacter missouriensis]OWJ85594.1 HflK protein [Haematobacter missouriensis]
MAGHSGGPWGGGGSGGGGGDNRGDDPRGGNRRPGEGPQIPELDQIMKKGQEQLRVLMGGRGTGTGGPRQSGPGLGITRKGVFLAIGALFIGWLALSFYTVRQEERSVELLFGRYYKTGEPGLNFAPWPVVTREIFSVTGERTLDIGSNANSRRSDGLMLTQDENLVDTEFQVVWNINDPSKYLFNLADPMDTIRAVSESAMRDIIARSQMAPILNRDRGIIASDLQQAVQSTLDTYDSGINIIRVNFDRADPPSEVIDSFRQVQAARQERDRLQNQADAYANRVLAGARGESARVLEEAEGYRAQAVNAAQGEASRFVSVYDEYRNAPDVTRRRMYLETMERVFGRVDKVIVDGVNGESGQGVLPLLPLGNRTMPQMPATGAAGSTTTNGENN